MTPAVLMQHQVTRICHESDGTRHAALDRGSLHGKAQEGQDQTVTVLPSAIKLAIELDDQSPRRTTHHRQASP